MEELFASFVLDKEQGLEIALRAENVAEATPVTSIIQKLPASHDFVEGIMHLREEAIPLINLKKRLGLVDQEYDNEAKVAIVKLFRRRYGLMFDDIREVFGAEPADIEKLDPALQTEDRIISALISRERGVRTLEVLELTNLFSGNTMELEKIGQALVVEKSERRNTSYKRYLVFSFANQLFGIPVEYSQEITFYNAVHQILNGGAREKDSPFSVSMMDIFRQADIDGILALRGKAVPVLNAQRLLSGELIQDDGELSEETRVLVISHEECIAGLVVEEVKNIESIPEDSIISIPYSEQSSVVGIYQKEEGQSIMLLDIEQLLCNHKKDLAALARISSETTTGKQNDAVIQVGAHHLITENCYLVFSIGQYMAVQLRDVQEIIERHGVLGMPGEQGYKSGVINLRGEVVPVISLRGFFNSQGRAGNPAERRLIICTVESKTVALEVDSIVTIFKQEQYQNATSLGAELTDKADILDRLIVFDNENEKKEHVLVINVHNLIRNHLHSVKE